MAREVKRPSVKARFVERINEPVIASSVLAETVGQQDRSVGDVLE